MKKEIGITLVALIVTIVILLILAGVAIGTLGGENGLISKVSQAKKTQIKAEMKEQLILVINELQLEKEGKATLDDVTQEWINRVITDYDCTIISDASISGKKVTMQKSGVIGKYIIDQNLNITEIEKDESSAELEYKAISRDGENINILITVKDTENGLSKIEFPNGNIIYCDKKEEIAIDYQVKLGVEYKIKITSENGQETEKTILIEDYWHTITKNLGEGISIDNTAVKAAYNKSYTATLTVGDTYIVNTIIVTMNGTDVTSTVYDETTGTINIEKVTGDIEITATTIKLEIETTIPTVNTSNSTSVTTSTAANSVAKGTTLYINFKATLKALSGGTITIKYNENEVAMPFAVTTNGKYIFTVTGTYQGKTTELKKVEVTVNQYQGAQGVVQYDAGDWTQEEIEELQSKSLYNINTSKTANSASGLNFTFGGFTYKGDTDNASYINNGTIVTSRNQSVGSYYKETEYKPNYDGWQILTSKEENGKTYVTSIVHAGSPENFVYYKTKIDDAYRAEYILSSGLRQTSYNTYSPRSWQMYVDENQKDLIADATDKDGNTVKDVHTMTYSEADLASSTIKNTGASYWTVPAPNTYNLWVVFYNRYVNYCFNYCFGVRPVVSMTSGVYIASGSGIEEDPYVLAKE